MRELVSFTNDIGQIINPGDDVIVITDTHQRIHTTKGKYVGMYGKQVQAQVPNTNFAYFVKGTDEMAPANFLKPLYGKGGPKWGTPEFKELREKLYEPYEFRKRNDLRITTLQRNRIYKVAV